MYIASSLVFRPNLAPRPLRTGRSKNGAKRTSNEPRRPGLMPFRGRFLLDYQNVNLKSGYECHPM